MSRARYSTCLEPCFLHTEHRDGTDFKLVGKTEVVKRPQEMGEQGYNTKEGLKLISNRRT